MIEEPRILRTSVQFAAVLPLVIPKERIREVMGPGLSEVLAALSSQGIKAAGPWFTHHHRMQPDTFDFEIGVPVVHAISPAGRVLPGELPAATVARTVFHGDYEGLGDAWQQFDAWIERQARRPRPDLWEVYLVGPEAEPDPANWRTELSHPILD